MLESAFKFPEDLHVLSDEMILIGTLQNRAENIFRLKSIRLNKKRIALNHELFWFERWRNRWFVQSMLGHRAVFQMEEAAFEH